MDKLDEILSRVSKIEEYLGMKKENMKPAYDIKETAIILGCSKHKVRKYLEFNFLEKFKIGHKIMVTSESIKRLIEDNKASNK